MRPAQGFEMDPKRDMLKNAAPLTIAIFLTIGFFGFIYLLFVSTEIPKENSAQLNILLGGIAAVWAKAISFFYDSSASSKAKDEVIGEIAKTAPTGTGNGNGKSAPINIPNAEVVKVETKEGDVNIASKQKESIIPNNQEAL